MSNILAAEGARCVYCGCVPFPFSILIFAAMVLGLLFGSFLNVCILRLPRHASIMRPGSHCLACGAPVRPWDNIPVLSWLLLRGRCRTCGEPISIQYPLVELGTTALFVACVLHAGASWQTLIDATACFLLLGLAVMDSQTMLLPDAFTLTGLGMAFLLRVFAPGGENRGALALHTLADAAIAAALLLVIRFAYRTIRKREGLGLGDVKLLAMMAAFLGLPLAMVACFFAVMSAALYALYIVAKRRATGTDRIAFGSFLATGGILAIFLGRPVLAWYLGLF